MEIGIWGDSITYGAGDSEALGWVGRLRKLLEKGDDVGVYNFGICGDTTDDLLKRFSVEADAIKPNIIVFAIGINDSKYPVGETENVIPLEKYEQNMQELLKLARNHTDKITIVGATKADETLVRKSGARFVNEVILTYNNFLKELSESESLTYVDVFDVLDIDTDLDDGLHPNAQGYEKLFGTIKEFVK
ncbi:MAG: SGNH/GDSL hydrolase family protein [Candidatus Uhrbacteria bacterium]|nr:SGNH/GDSL hydrolase family protein [Candidatus Uhrbacteria bacterium]